MLYSKVLRILNTISLSALAGMLLAACTQSISPALPASSVATQLDSGRSNADLQRAPLANVRSEAASTTYSATVLRSSPTAYYQLNDSSATLANTVAGGITGVYGSGVRRMQPALTQGSSGSAGFPGGSTYNANGFASTSAAAALQPARPTVEAWFKLTANSAANTYIPLVIYGNQGTTYGLYLQGQGTFDTLFYQQTNVGAGRLLLHGLTNLKAGITYHVVAAFDGSKVTLYVNGLVDQNASYPGSVAYATNAPVGLQIGGQLASTRPPFPGSIAEVALYGAPLNGASVLTHFLAGQLVQMVSELAVPADTFVDSIGVNTHWGDSGSPYSSQFTQVKTLLQAAGIRHFRDNIGFGPQFVANVRQLASAKIFGTYVVSQTSTMAQIQSYPALVTPSLEQFEAPNEMDDQGGQPNWVQPCIDIQKSLYSWVKGSSATAKYPVLGPGLAYTTDFAKIGNLSSYLDYGNFHGYMGTYNPGYVGGPGGGVKAMVSREEVTSGSKPVESTESGYGTNPSIPSNNVDYPTDLRYITRLFFEQYNDGISRSYTYELLDEASSVISFGANGLITRSLAAKPAYYGVKSIIGALQDPGAPFKAGALTYSLSGLSTVHHLLMEKRNGTYVLAIWQEVPSWDTAAYRDISVPSQSVTLSTAQTFSGATFSTIEESGQLSTVPLTWINRQLELTVTDQVSLVTLKP